MKTLTAQRRTPVRGGAPSTVKPDLKQELKRLCKTRSDKLRAVAFLLRELLKRQPVDVEWALTDPDGKVYAYVTGAAEWQRQHVSSSRAAELAARSRSAMAHER